MRGGPFKAAVYIDNPYSKLTYTTARSDRNLFDNIYRRGIEFEVFYKIFEEILHLSINYEHSGRPEAVNRLLTGEADFLVPSLPMYNFDRQNGSDDIALTEVILDLDINIVYRKRKQMANFSLASIFSQELMLTIWVTAAVVIMFKMVTKHYFHAGRMISPVGWYICVSVILGLFSNLITVSIVIPETDVKPFEDIEDLAESIGHGACKLVVIEGQIELDRHSQQNWTVAFHDVINQNRSIVVKDRHDLATLIEGSSDCIVGLDYALPEYYEHHFCHVNTFMIKNIGKIPFCFFFNKRRMSKKLVNDINSVFRKESVLILYEKVVHIYLGRLSRPSCHDADSRAAKDRVPMSQLADAFILAGAGFGLSFVILGIEWIILLKNPR